MTQSKNRRRQQQEQSEVSDGCDESKCVSTGLSKYSNYSFTCYGDGEYYPMMCADGYQPRVVENETLGLDSYPSWVYWQDSGEVLIPYFTCCPPDLSSETKVNRHCSNPYATADDNNNITVICDDVTWQHPRQMKTNTDLYNGQLVHSYMCCDSIIVNDDNTTTDFLDDTECLPYRNEFYAESKVVQNKYGMIAVITCDFLDEDFQFPRSVESEMNDPLSSAHYECCKTGPALPPFVQDSAFNLTVYPVIAVSSIGAISSVILILGLSIPLLKQLKNGTAQITQRTSRRLRGSAELGYSTYNFYLVYLAIPDLIYSFIILGLYGSCANQKFNQKFNPEFYGVQIFFPEDIDLFFPFFYSIANLYLNAVVSYEVLTLLRKSHQLRSSDPPTILKATLQTAAVYVFAILVYVTHYLIKSAALKAYNEGDFVRSDNLSGIASLVILPPGMLSIGYVGYVCIIIWRRGYMPSINGISVRDKALRELAWYFFRIISVFCVCWFPAIICYASSTFAGKSWGFVVSGLFLALQPTLSTCMAMTKSDVKKYIFDLITLSYVRTNKSQEVPNSH